jgi:hypothetical protein
MANMDKFKVLKEPKVIIIAVLLAVFIGVIAINPGTTGAVTFEIEDKCGQFLNLMSHTVQTENACKVRCTAQCQAKDLKYGSVDFEEVDSGCNKCSCNCRQ